MEQFLFVWHEDVGTGDYRDKTSLHSRKQAAAVIAHASKKLADDLTVPFPDCRAELQKDTTATEWLYTATVGDYMVWRNAVIIRLNSRAPKRTA